MPESIVQKLDFKDTFLDLAHVRESFPGKQVTLTTQDASLLKAPFRVTFPMRDGKVWSALVIIYLTFTLCVFFLD